MVVIICLVLLSEQSATVVSQTLLPDVDSVALCGDPALDGGDLMFKGESRGGGGGGPRQTGYDFGKGTLWPLRCC